MKWVRIKKHIGRYHFQNPDGKTTFCKLPITPRSEYCDHLIGSACVECRGEAAHRRDKALEAERLGLLPEFAPRPHEAEAIGLARSQLLCGRTLGGMEDIYTQCLEGVVPPSARSGKSVLESEYVRPLLTELHRFVRMGADGRGK